MFSDNQNAKAGRPAIYDDDAVFSDIMAYLDKNICQTLTVEKISRDNLIGVSQLKKLFRNQQMNFTQIADYLGYTSVHYFSRYFKNITNMSPIEYRSSIIQRANRV